MPLFSASPGKRGSILTPRLGQREISALGRYRKLSLNPLRNSAPRSRTQDIVLDHGGSCLRNHSRIESLSPALARPCRAPVSVVLRRSGADERVIFPSPSGSALSRCGCTTKCNLPGASAQRDSVADRFCDH